MFNKALELKIYIYYREIGYYCATILTVTCHRGADKENYFDLIA